MQNYQYLIGSGKVDIKNSFLLGSSLAKHAMSPIHVDWD